MKKKSTTKDWLDVISRSKDVLRETIEDDLFDVEKPRHPVPERTSEQQEGYDEAMAEMTTERRWRRKGAKSLAAHWKRVDPMWVNPPKDIQFQTRTVTEWRDEA